MPRKKTDYEERIAQVIRLSRSTQTETHYYVPGSGHGTTTNPDEASRWAMSHSRLIGERVPVLKREVTRTPWEVDTYYAAAERESSRAGELMPRAEKVWGLRIQDRGQDARLIVRATSQKKALELLHQAGYRNISLGYFRDYGSITGNKQELAAATETGVWITPDRYAVHREFERKL